jgi:tRNA dimethylallyltransferase
LIRGGKVDPAIRSRLQAEVQAKGREHLYRRLEEVDPTAASRLHPHDTYRIIRALEAYERTGRPISALRQRHLFQEEPYHVLKIGLMTERKKLYQSIDARVDAMIHKGLREEVRNLLEMGYTPAIKAMQSLGYKQMTAHLQGKYDLAEAVRLIKRDTKRYAKRQITWFKADTKIHWVAYPQERDGVFRTIEGFLRN